jgi:hypothetical protein
MIGVNDTAKPNSSGSAGKRESMSDGNNVREDDE